MTEISDRTKLYLIIGMVMIGGAFLYALDPCQFAFAPKCPFKLLTGLSCPGCGFQRAMHALLNGRFMEAVRYNLFLCFSVPYLLAIIICRYGMGGERQLRLLSFLEGKLMAWTYVILFTIWFFVRNILNI